jgi:hypothetical protein
MMWQAKGMGGGGPSVYSPEFDRVPFPTSFRPGERSANRIERRTFGQGYLAEFVALLGLQASHFKLPDVSREAR